MARTRLAHTERQALCDLALELGEAAPTLCEGWDAKDLVVHLLVRERSPLAAPGVVIPQLRWLTDLETRRVARGQFVDLVQRLRRPVFTLVAIPAVDDLLNTLEFFVHHEDLRRAQPGWRPRELGRREQSILWAGLRRVGPGLSRRAGAPPLSIRRTDKGSEVTLVTGENPVLLSGPPAEILLFLFGRRETAGLAFEGPPDAVERLRAANLAV